jgi:hypothetical protein
MIAAKSVLIAAALIMLPMLPADAQERPAYRDFTLGSPLARVLDQVHATTSDVTLVHQRPALIQDLRWRPPYVPLGGAAPPKDAVQQMVFSFCNDQLFRITIEYDRTQTDGMTDADMVAALSERYGLQLTASRALNTSTVASQAVGEWSTPIAQWSEGDAVVVLLRRAFTSGFQVVVSSAKLEGLALSAVAESVRLDRSEAPAREIARQKIDAEATRLIQEKARSENKAAFRP